jgi:hypothetical protein
MSINSSGKLKSIINAHKRDSNVCKESINSGFSVGNNYGFGLPRNEKPIPKERKDSKKSLREGIKYVERTPTERCETKMKNFSPNNASQLQPKISMEQIKVIKNGQAIKKIHRIGKREVNGTSKHKERLYHDDRKKVDKEVSPNPAQSPVPK